MSESSSQSRSERAVIHRFDAPPEGDPASWASMLGGKGAGLARMQALGLPVPPGFTIPTAVCNRVLASGWDDDLSPAIAAGIADLEATMGRRLGDGDDPLLVSVRSGAPVSMPGMMDTVLNAGMTVDAAAGLGRRSGDPRFGWDTYRRFIESYTKVVGGADDEALTAELAAACGDRRLDDVPVDELASVLEGWRHRLAERGWAVPTEPLAQVIEAVRAVFGSWNSERAVHYRRREGIADDLGTAATVQAMVFGNRSDESGTGVAFTRDPSTGRAGLVGDFLVRAQGEDVVAGTHDTLPLAELDRRWPAVGERLGEMAAVLEHELADLVDIEFTIEDSTLWLLQARVGKRSPRAAVRVAVAMANDPAFPLDRAGAVSRTEHLFADPPTEEAAVDTDATVLATGLGASPGRAIGEICVDPDAAVEAEAAGTDLILVRRETSPADIHGMAAARGLVTTLGGVVSHAAVVARSWGVPAVVGAGAITVEPDGLLIDGRALPIGTVITIDGDRGEILLGSHPGEGAEVPEVAVLRRWQRDDDDGAADSGVGPVAAAESASSELDDGSARRALLLKGMATAEGVASFAGVTQEAAVEGLDRLVALGHAQTGPGDRFLMTPEGTAAVEADFAAEAEVATPVIEPHLDRFHELNHRFKEVVTAWQMRDVDGEQVLNEHDDPDYDAAVLTSLAGEVDVGIGPIIRAVAEVLPRFARYEQRLATALAAIGNGDLSMMASPLKDSYHTVWFELHEELIRLSGRNRADEAAAGRA